MTDNTATKVGREAADGVKAQYQTPDGINARIALHANWSTASISWPRWVAEQLDLAPEATVLEVGCGSAWLWQEAAAALPPGVRLTLSDRSPTMIESVRTSLGSVLPPQTAYRAEDVLGLSFPAGTFDAVIANHMLYLVDERPQALRELARVLKPAGRAFTATNGPDHLRELTELAQRHARPGRQVFEGGVDTSRFDLTNGAEQLREAFTDVTVRSYDDGLVVKEADPVIAYVASLPSWRDAVDLDALRADVEERIARDGAFTVTKSTGLFVSAGPRQR
ncbi:class I SAM-dependent methyltransferase [Dactylosporangium cerinum]|uniref:Class I SAM-dependent methyltransferase n=1 Tax=Dactylosporangium cerinum TaxID=1434730 RepID=A0ABV9VVG3_9ACTN